VTFLSRLTPEPLRDSVSSFADSTRHHRRSLRVAATAVLAVTTVVGPVAAQAAYADTPSHSSTAPSTASAVTIPTGALASETAIEALATAQQTVKQVQGRADTTQLGAAIAALQGNFSPDPAVLAKLTGAATSAVITAQAAAAAHDAG
jgi:hypothetical protein